MLAVVVHAASIQDRDGAKLVLAKLKGRFARLKLIWADGGYAGQLIEWTRALGRWVLEIVKRSDDMTGFVVLPKRWIVERTFGWFGRYRRLSKDNPSYLNALWWDEMGKLYARMRTTGRIDLLDNRLGPGGLDITQMQPPPKKK